MHVDGKTRARLGPNLIATTLIVHSPKLCLDMHRLARGGGKTNLKKKEKKRKD